MENNFNEVGKFYEGHDIAKFWEVIHQRHMHVGYWDNENIDAPISEASKKFTDIMIEKVSINEKGNFIDIGCGFGLPAILLAKRKGCNVFGVTASDYQKAEAEKYAKIENVSNLTNFLVCDAKNTPFENDKFDAGWFFESIFHIGYTEALFEARRILKPNATLLLTDFIALSPLNEADKDNLYRIFHVKSLKTFEEYPDMLDQNGFEKIEIIDVTNYSIKPRKNKYIEAMNTYKDELIKIGGSEEFYDKMKKFWDSVNDLIEKNIGYAIIICKRKSSAT